MNLFNLLATYVQYISFQQEKKKTDPIHHQNWSFYTSSAIFFVRTYFLNIEQYSKKYWSYFSYISLNKQKLFVK